MSTKWLCCCDTRISVIVIAALDVIAGVAQFAYGFWTFTIMFLCIGERPRTCTEFVYLFGIIGFVYGICGCIIGITSGIYLCNGARKRNVQDTKKHLISSIIGAVLYFAYTFWFTIVLALGTFRDWDLHLALVVSYFVIIIGIILKVQLIGCSYSFYLEMKTNYHEFE